ncbi:putative elongator complex protein 1 [Drosophila persimilis]|uniref:putative elongator complex protein 1 n=1 Tax=Drosophila persimilis TaxID=7234 RepID=UPI000F09840B|nr:putative elongator complex protein 1 [Drosophila persimilis]
MRNLKLQFCNELQTKVPQARQMLQGPEVRLEGTETTYIVTDSNVYAVEGTGSPPAKVIADLPDIVAAEFLQLTNVICVATRAGEVLLIDPDTLATSEGTYCDVGIERMAWSPSQEVVAFITTSHNVVVMNSTFDVIAEQPLEAELPADQQFINVGWGKKETQFHGSAGKQAAKQSTDQPAQMTQELLSQDVNIAWRGDGAYFVVSYESGGGRTFKVYDSEGKLQHTAEKSSNLREIIAWRPSGNWIALPQWFPNKSTISLFEKNGLRHRELVLPFDLQEEPILQLKWSEDSDILAIRTAKEKEQQQRVYLYTIGNYHWYLKQVLVYADTDPVAVVHWDTRMGAEQTLHVLLESGKQLAYCWAFEVEPYARHGIVGVIDGKRLLLTDFARAVVPPPMSQRVLQLDEYINAIAWDDQQLCVYTCDRRIHFYELKDRLQQQPEPTSGSIKLPPLHGEQLLELANFTYFSRDGQLLATTSALGITRLLWLQKSENEVCHWIDALTIDGLVNALSRATHNCRHIYAHTLDSGKTYDVSLASDNALAMEQVSAKQFEPSLERGLVTLRRQNLLQLGRSGEPIAEDVTSFLFIGTYLAYTQMNTLHFVDADNRQHLASRNIERGAKLVTVIDEEARVVLQLPRGNLEAIYPRLLVLDHVRVLLNALTRRDRYLEAMKLLRKNRINLNIICDTNVAMFVDHVDDFLREIQETQWLCLFISELQNEDTTAMYPRRANESPQRLPRGFKFEEKVSYICALFLSRMTETAEDRTRFRLPLITVFVRLGDVNSALKLIRDLGNPAQEDQLLKYLMYLVDINELYNVALGSYNLETALFVAQKSQKDPKEFLQYLNELKALPEDYRKFRIDDNLKRYSSAVQHLARCGEEHHDEAMEFIRKHSLYTVALSSYKAHPEFHRRLCVAYADHLRASAKLENASLMYERGGELQQALLSARHTLDWQRVMVLAKALGDQSLDQVALSLVGPLQQQGRHLEAAELVKEHVQDKEKHLEVLLEGHLYGKAIYEAGLQGGNVLDEKVAPALVAHAGQMHGSLKSDLQLFLEYKQRLLDIRQRRASGAEMEGDGDVDIDEVDLLSDTTSMHSSRYSGTSRGTGKTFRSSKNRRKHERKLLSLKPGNPFEDIALIDALHQHVTKIGQQQQVVRDTCKALLQLGGGEDTLANALQREFKTLLQTVESALDEIWIPELVGGGASGSLAQHLTGPNVDYMALQKEQRYALISPLKRFKPQLNAVDWQHEILQ